MAFLELKYFSKSLGKATAANIILPENHLDKPLSTFYLLHGLSDDHSVWQRRTSIERYVTDLPMMVVMPDSGRGFYCDAEAGMRWESAIIKDLLPYVDSVFRTQATRESRCVAGLSMGGYGAIKFGLKYPEIFCSAVSHSGALSFGHYPITLKPEDSFATEFARVVGENPQGSDNDCFALAEKMAKERRTAIRIDCGTEDFLIESNREFHAHLEKIGYSHEYVEHSGAHTWEYWDEHIQETIAFHCKNLGI